MSDDTAITNKRVIELGVTRWTVTELRDGNAYMLIGTVHGKLIGTKIKGRRNVSQTYFTADEWREFQNFVKP